RRRRGGADRVGGVVRHRDCGLPAALAAGGEAQIRSPAPAAVDAIWRTRAAEHGLSDTELPPRRDHPAILPPALRCGVLRRGPDNCRTRDDTRWFLPVERDSPGRRLRRGGPRPDNDPCAPP